MPLKQQQLGDEMLLSGLDNRLRPLPELSLKGRTPLETPTTPQELYRPGKTSAMLLGDYIRLLLIHLYSGEVKIKAFGFSETDSFFRRLRVGFLLSLQPQILARVEEF